MTSSTFASVDEAARIVGVTPQTITRGIRSGEIEADKVGRSWVIARNEIDDYLRRNNLTPEPDDHPVIERPDGPVALSFFSGALGLDLGMERAGIRASLLCENDRKCRMTIASMRPKAALIGDIAKYSADEVLSMAGVMDGRVDVMFGGPPCQAFSTAGARRAFDDARGNVFLKYIELASLIKPTYLVIENVRGLLSAAYPTERGGEPVKGGALSIVLKMLGDAGYSVSFNLYNAANFGAPQIRERVVLIGKRGGDKVGYLTPTNSNDPAFDLPAWRTFREAVDGLPDIQHSAEFPEKRLRFSRCLEKGNIGRIFRMMSKRRQWVNHTSSVAVRLGFTVGFGLTGRARRLLPRRQCLQPTCVIRQRTGLCR